MISHNSSESKETVAAVPSSIMQLGTFSISLAVKDIASSRTFYEKLGFHPIGGNIEQNWLILRNNKNKTTIGLFQGMIEKNLLTFNPGWNHEGEEALDDFQDVCDLQAALKNHGITPVPGTEVVDPSLTGPASFTIVDPDGNPILIDQHVEKRVK